MTVSIDITDLIKTMENAVKYTEGFLLETQRQRLTFNRELGQYVLDRLYEYIDSMAQASPETLHHMYEWGQTGSESGRLFSFNMDVTASYIIYRSEYHESQSISPTGTEPFVDKAAVMESGISVTIEPKDAEVLAFEVGDNTIFTTGPVFVEHPGGEYVAGSFHKTVESFFTQYVTRQILDPLLRRMSRPSEYKKYFAAGTRSGRRPGQIAAKQWVKNARGIDGIV